MIKTILGQDFQIVARIAPRENPDFDETLMCSYVFASAFSEAILSFRCFRWQLVAGRYARRFASFHEPRSDFSEQFIFAEWFRKIVGLCWLCGPGALINERLTAACGGFEFQLVIGLIPAAQRIPSSK